MKKICFVTTLGSTIRSFLVDLANYLVKEHEYDVTFMSAPDPELEKVTSDRIHFIPVPMKRGIAFDGLKVIWQMYRIFKREKFDIVQYSTKNASTYASIAAWMAGIKCRLYCQWGMMFIALHGLKRLLLKADEKMVAGLSTVIETESFSIYEEAVKHHVYPAEKSSVIWNGSACGVKLSDYDLSQKEKWRKEIREQFRIPMDATVFGYCGRLTRDKGLNELLASFKEIHQKTNAYLMLIGSYDNALSIDQELLEWAKSSPKVVFTGQVSGVSRYYSALDVFMSLSYREGFGLVVIEAAAMAVPGIVTNVPGQRDTLVDQQTGILVPGHNVEEVVKAMNFFSEHQEECRRMGDNARKHVEEGYEQNELFRRLAEHRNQLIG